MNCRSCGGESFGEVIDLGLMPLANNLLNHPDQPCPRWPLHVVFCHSCSLAQLTEAPPPEAMFDNYLYFSRQSQTMVAHAESLVNRYVASKQKVLEIASNDGYLLHQAHNKGADVLGIDPAVNIAKVANASGIPTRCAYFSAALANELVDDWGFADVVFANNVLAHVPDPNEIARGIKAVLARDGIAHVEVPSLVRMVEACAFDTIYHEHHCYFTLSALKDLFNRHGLRIVDVVMVQIHGGSFHLQLAHEGDETAALKICQQERQAGAFDDSFYELFAQRMNHLNFELEKAIGQFNTVVAYGAAAKGVILLNSFGFDSSRIPWVADVSPHKQGKYIPGTCQAIVSPEQLQREQPDAALLLAWNIKDEITRRNSHYMNQGGRFIVPIPEVSIL